MKAIGIKMVDLIPMSAEEAVEKGYKTGVHEQKDPGYEVIYPDGYKSWCPKIIADKAYFKLHEDNNGSVIFRDDVKNFIKSENYTTVGDKTTVANITGVTGFEYIDYSSCVSPAMYDKELGSEYAYEKIISKIWEHLGFVLQWAKNGISIKQ